MLFKVWWEDLRKAVRLWFVQLSTWGWGLHSVFLPLYLGTSCPHHARGGVQMTGAMEDSKYFEKLSVSSYQVHVSMQYSQRYLLEWYLSTTEFNPSESLSYKGRKWIRPYFHIIHVLRSDARINETKRQWENSIHVPAFCSFQIEHLFSFVWQLEIWSRFLDFDCWCIDASEVNDVSAVLYILNSKS